MKKQRAPAQPARRIEYLHNLSGSALSALGLKQAYAAANAALRDGAPLDVVVETTKGELQCHVTPAGVLREGRRSQA